MKHSLVLRYILVSGVLGALALSSLRWLMPPPANGEPAVPSASLRSDSHKPVARKSSPAKPADDGTVRQTAHVWSGSPLGPDGAFEDSNRDYALRTPEALDAMGIKKGDTVADIGAGGGWLTVRLANRVGENGTVYAEEILKKYTDYIEKRAAKAGLKNIKTILGTTNDPKLPENSLDAAIILNAYHEFEYPLVMLRKIYNAMKPGGRLGFIERDTDQLRRDAREAYAKTGKIKRRVTESRDDNPYTDDHRLAVDVVEREAAQIGFRKVSILELRYYHYLLVVEKPQTKK